MTFKLGMTVDLCMAYADARFSDLDLHTKSQWIGRGKQYLSYGIQTAHDGRLMHEMYGYVHLDDLDLILNFENVCKARSFCFSLQGFPHCQEFTVIRDYPVTPSRKMSAILLITSHPACFLSRGSHIVKNSQSFVTTP